MHEGKKITISDPGSLESGPGWDIFLACLVIVGGVVFALALAVDSIRAWYNFLIEYFFFMALGVSGLVLAAVHYAAGSTWSVTVRRVAEGLSGYLWVSLVLSGAFFWAIPVLYEWAAPEHIHMWHEKHIYLCTSCFMLRELGAYAAWIGVGGWIVRNSLRQDISGDEALYWKNRKLAPIFLLLFALTFTLLSVDLLMSLEESWYSAIFPVYTFSGLFLSGFAATALLVVVLRRAGYLSEAVRKHHLRDLGTWMMAFSAFMVYIGFSQYMLIWYGNLPVEIGYMIKRSQNGWGYVFAALPLLKWILPFVVLMPERARSSEKVIAFVAVGVIVGQWLDIFWMVAPAFSAHRVTFGWVEVGVFLGFLGLFGLSIRRFYSRHRLVAINDPRLQDCLEGGYTHV